jgi:LysR family transcriptional regulator (chromosome initiation inhibitor)
MPLNADQLEAFWAVNREGGFHKAAAALHLTQSAVTQRIHGLEAALGQALFVRAARSVTLTPAGQALLRHCRDRRDAEAALLATLASDTAAPEGLAGRLAVASTTVAGRAWVLPALAELGRRHEALELSHDLDDELDPFALLESCRADAVLAETPVARAGFESVKVGAMPFVLVASPALVAGWPDAPPPAQLLSLRAIDFNPGDRVTRDHLALVAPDADWAGLRRRFVNDDLGILEWVLAGGGFSVLPVPVVEVPLADGRLRRLYPAVTSERPLYLSWASGVAAGAMAAFRSIMTDRLA